MNVIKIVGEIIDLREELKETAREVEIKAKRLDRCVDELLEFLKHRGLVETRRVK